MAKVNKRNTLKRRGRPATGQDPVTAIRLSSELRALIDAWAKRQENKPGRSDAIRRLIERGLAAEPQRAMSKKSSAEASAMAGNQIDRMGDKGATDEQRASRKRRLLKGPKEFRDMRGDQAKRRK
jgi:hypothetical protein